MQWACPSACFAHFIIFYVRLSFSLSPDGLSLLALKSAIESDPTRVLDSWSPADLFPCHWPGIVCSRSRVTELSLPNRGLVGYIPSELGNLKSLRRLSLAYNNFSDSIPPNLLNATSLISLDLSGNSLSGPIPDQIKDLENLMHLDFSSNFLNGSLPESLVQLRFLLGTLNLSHNRFSGGVPAAYGELPVVVNLDLRYNNLTGEIPQVGSLLNQGPTAFTGNPNLCGFPLPTPCPGAQNATAFPSSEEPRKPNNPTLPSVAYTRTSMKSSIPTTIPIIVGVSVAIGAVSVSLWLVRKKWRNTKGKIEKAKTDSEAADGRNSKFVVIDGEFRLELEDLLRASAYVVSKSRSGILYKVATGEGSDAGPTTMAVRRLNEDGATWRVKEFESEVDAIGKVQHPNIVRLRASYYSDDEKLLVTDFITNGNLYAALHGSPSESWTPLTWAARLQIAQGTARGLAHIHESSPRRFVHGNLKSTKILLDHHLQPYISGFGLNNLTSGASKKLKAAQNPLILAPGSSVWDAYSAPEVRSSGGKVTQKCDVYSFGIILIEILTGLVPDPKRDGFVRRALEEERPVSEVIDAALSGEGFETKQMTAFFQIAIGCTELDPELRPRMRAVSDRLDGIKAL